MLIGHLGNDPEVRATAGGMLVAALSVATSHGKKNADGSGWTNETEWHRVKLFDRQAEVAQQYLRKGSQVYIEGRLKTNKWQDKDGQDRWTTEVVGSEMQMLGGKPEGGNPEGASASSAIPAQAQSQGGITSGQVTRVKMMISEFLDHHDWMLPSQKKAFYAEFNAQNGVQSCKDITPEEYRLITQPDNFSAICNRTLEKIAPLPSVSAHDVAKANGYAPQPAFNDDIPF
jgi:single-strand DNA-binding protein